MPNALHLDGCGVGLVHLTGQSDDGAVGVHANDLGQKDILSDQNGNSETAKLKIKRKSYPQPYQQCFFPLIFINIPNHWQHGELPGYKGAVFHSLLK